MIFETYDKWSTVIVSVILVLGITFAVLKEPPQCVESSKVVDIVSAQNRSVNVLLDNDTIKNIDQPKNLSDGSTICTKWSK